jgi:hypothetical protein
VIETGMETVHYNKNKSSLKESSRGINTPMFSHGKLLNVKIGDMEAR